MSRRLSGSQLNHCRGFQRGVSINFPKASEKSCLLGAIVIEATDCFGGQF